jgi:hypothetical protein
VILYSIVPPEIVFQGYNGEGEVKYMEADYKGERVIVSQASDRQYRIDRLISTNPGAFLDASFMPGNIVDEKELKK